MKRIAATIALAHPFEVGFENAGALLDGASHALEKIGLEVINTKVVLHSLETVQDAVRALEGKSYDAVIICIATWSEDHHLLDLYAEINKPIILRAFPHRETGSLCCAHQIGAVFTDIGREYSFVYGDAEDEQAAIKIMQIATAYSLARKMQTVRTGAIGGRVKGMTEIAYDEFAIKKKLGARVVNIDEAELTDIVNEIPDSEAEAELAVLDLAGRGCVVTSTREDILESVKYYLAMKRLVQIYQLEALSVKCYTKYMGKVCLGYSLLAEEGIVASCEGDVTSSITMKILYELSGKPVNNTDLLFLDEKENTMLFSHCGSSGFSIAQEPVQICPVRLAESGVCTMFTVQPGKVTAVNIVGSGENLRLAVMVGDAVPCGMEFPGNPVKIKFSEDVNVINHRIVENGIGHHWMVAYGDYTEELRMFCKINKIKMFEL